MSKCPVSFSVNKRHVGSSWIYISIVVSQWVYIGTAARLLFAFSDRQNYSSSSWKYCENFTSHWTGNHRVTTTANGKNEPRGKKRDSIFKLSNKKGKEETTSRMKWEKKSQLCYLILHLYLILWELKKPSKVRLDWCLPHYRVNLERHPSL